ncbi:thioredoxin [Aeromonas phage AS-yj]|uniref:Thioredoxin n=4 Tax=Caudoviricetes TaxID=2731619 RepID=A0A291LDJ9_9CAUD|nr:thioredoxin [Aeromonas phage AS-zj]ASU00530.1 thioredoxin [Aeromonas phage AS-zj]ATI17467.1 thioredoxin [Aeromonas phage AS-szw]ATI18044.1 thioredoxin [Aeromonas phage AS-yj]QAX99042.1 thioredoxin [Aeromonas phage Assk]
MITIFGFDPDNYKCVPCIKAKKFADTKKLDYVFKPILKTGTSEESRSNKKELGERRKALGLEITGFTMPQIFVGDVLIGGFDELRNYEF